MKKNLLCVFVLLLFVSVLGLDNDAIAKGGLYSGKGFSGYSTYRSKSSGYSKSYSYKRTSFRNSRKSSYSYKYAAFKTPRYRSSLSIRSSLSRPIKNFNFASFGYKTSTVGKSYAVDGDTFYSGGVKYRIRGIDTPEIGQPRSEEAKIRLQQLLNSGNVSIEPKAIDKYGRTVATVTVNGEDVSNTLQREGLSK